MDLLTSPEAWIALGTLTILEIVLGIDNIVFITVLADRLPPEQRPKARQVGLALAMLTRILLLFTITLIIGLTQPLFALFGHSVSGRDLILIIGGLFLLTKSTREIHDKMEGGVHEARGGTKAATLRTAKTSPGSVCRTIAGSTRESEHSTTAKRGFCPWLSRSRYRPGASSK